VSWAQTPALPRRAALRLTFDAIGHYERGLTARLLAGLAKIDTVKVRGITDLRRLADRCPPFP